MGVAHISFKEHSLLRQCFVLFSLHTIVMCLELLRLTWTRNMFLVLPDTFSPWYLLYHFSLDPHGMSCTTSPWILLRPLAHYNSAQGLAPGSRGRSCTTFPL